MILRCNTHFLFGSLELIYCLWYSFSDQGLWLLLSIEMSIGHRHSWAGLTTVLGGLAMDPITVCSYLSLSFSSPFLFKIYLSYAYCVSVWVYALGWRKIFSGARRGLWGPWAGVSEIFASYLTWALGTEFGSFGNTTLLLNHWAIISVARLSFSQNCPCSFLYWSFFLFILQKVSFLICSFHKTRNMEKLINSHLTYKCPACHFFKLMVSFKAWAKSNSCSKNR